MKYRPWLLAGAGLAAALILRSASCDQAATDRWEQDVRVVLKLHRRVVEANARRDRWEDSVHALERAHLRRADSLEGVQARTRTELVYATSPADSLRLVEQGWAQCRLQVSELTGAHTLCAERADTGKASQRAAEADAGRQAEVLGDRPRQPRSLLVGVGADATVIRGCWSLLAGPRLEARKPLWIFELDGRAAVGWGSAQCNGPLTAGPGGTGGVTLGF